MFGKKKKVQVKSYKSQKEFDKDARKMAERGYVVQSSTAAQAGRSKKSWLALGAFNFARKQNVSFTVTYELKGG